MKTASQESQSQTGIRLWYFRNASQLSHKVSWDPCYRDKFNAKSSPLTIICFIASQIFALPPVAGSVGDTLYVFCPIAAYHQQPEGPRIRKF
jgi:hypothetical protein